MAGGLRSLRSAFYSLELACSRNLADFNAAQTGGKKVSFADLVVLGGCAAVEKGAKAGVHALTVPFTPGRTDATQANSDAESFAALESRGDGFRNYVGQGEKLSPEMLFLDKANMLVIRGTESKRPNGDFATLFCSCGYTEHS